MKKARVYDNKKKIGRPPTGVGTLVGQRWREDQLDEIDQWRRRQSDMPGRAEAIRRLVELGLTVKVSVKPVSKPDRSARAAELTSKTIGGMIDPSAPPEERAQRRRRLTKGPLEFREDRVDLPKAKGSPK
jgi:hypothetical protein